jgi:hypothetical protein
MKSWAVRCLFPLALFFAFFCFLACPQRAAAQAIRFDTLATTTNAACQPGSFCPLLAIPGATIKVCVAPACASTATTYTDITEVTACPGTAQLTAPSGANPTQCVSLTDNQGNFGFWIAAPGPGVSYNYYITLPFSAGASTFGPYPLTPAGGGSGSGQWINTGLDLYNANSGNVGIGGAPGSFGSVAGSLQVNGTQRVLRDLTNMSGVAATYYSNAANNPYVGWGQASTSWILGDGVQKWMRLNTTTVGSMQGVMVLPPAGAYCFPSSGDATNTPSLCLTPSAGGPLEVNSGTKGSTFDVNLRKTNSTGYTFAGGLPAVSNGNAYYCSDCTVTSSVDNTAVGSGAGCYIQDIGGVHKCSGF